MIRHIVLWRLSAQTADERSAAVAAIAGALEPLVGVIGGVIALTVRPNSVDAEGNWDAALVADFTTAQALADYQVHPAHVAATAVVRENAVQRACVDYEQ